MDSHKYVIEPASSAGVVFIRHVNMDAFADQEQYGEESDEEQHHLKRRSAEIDAPRPADLSAAHKAGIPANPAFKILSVYTGDARREAGGIAVIEAKLNMMIAQTNRAFEMSGVKAHLELAGGTHREITTDHQFLKNGHGPNSAKELLAEQDIRRWRDESEADIVSLLIGHLNINQSIADIYCGVSGNGMNRSQTLTEIKDRSIIVSTHECLNISSPVHLIGRLLGVTSLYSPPTFPPYRDYDKSFYFVLNENVPIVASLFERLPTITHHPHSVQFDENTALTLMIQAHGVGNLSYQWFHDGEEMQGAVDNNLIIQEPSSDDKGSYFVRVSNEHGSSDSLPANIQNILLYQQPVDVVVDNGDRFQLEVEACGQSSLTYQWFLNDQLIAGATQNRYTKPNASLFNEGTYYVQVTDASGSMIQSRSINVDVIRTPPKIINSFGYATAIGHRILVIVYMEQYELTYQYRWLKDGKLIEGRQSRYIDIFEASESDAGTYHVEVSEGSQTVTSDDIVISFTE